LAANRSCTGSTISGSKGGITCSSNMHRYSRKGSQTLALAHHTAALHTAAPTWHHREVKRWHHSYYDIKEQQQQQVLHATLGQQHRSFTCKQAKRGSQSIKPYLLQHLHQVGWS
jgi:hypothetical protein